MASEKSSRPFLCPSGSVVVSFKTKPFDKTKNRTENTKNGVSMVNGASSDRFLAIFLPKTFSLFFFERQSCPRRLAGATPATCCGSCESPEYHTRGYDICVASQVCHKHRIICSCAHKVQRGIVTLLRHRMSLFFPSRGIPDASYHSSALSKVSSDPPTCQW